MRAGNQDHENHLIIRTLEGARRWAIPVRTNTPYLNSSNTGRSLALASDCSSVSSAS